MNISISLMSLQGTGSQRRTLITRDLLPLPHIIHRPVLDTLHEVPVVLIDH